MGERRHSFGPRRCVCQECGQTFSEAEPHSHVTPTMQRCAPCCKGYSIASDPKALALLGRLLDGRTWDEVPP